MKSHYIFLTMAGLLALSCGDKDHESMDLDALVNKMTEVSGGDSAIAAIETHVSKFIVIKQDSTGEETLYVTYKRPDKIRFDSFNADDSLIFSQFTNGKEAWVYYPDKDVLPTHKKKAQEFISWAEHWIDEWRIYKEIGLDIEYVEDVKLGNKQCYKMRVTDRFGIESYWYVNQDTYLIARITYPSIDHFTGKMGESRIENFTEFHRVGVLFPTKLVGNDEKVLEMVKWTMNNSLNDSIFNMSKVDVSVTSRYLQQMAENGAYVK